MRRSDEHSSLPPNVCVFASYGELAAAAAAETFRVVREALALRPLCHIALAGGETPRGVYRTIGLDPAAQHIAWHRVHLYFGDERMVSPTDAGSNYRMAAEELLSRIPIPEANIHRIRGEMPAADAAMLYEEELAAIFRDADTTFDLTYLGLGKDGHTASLFPGTEVLEERQHTVRPVYVPSLGVWRTTLTIPAINRSREIIFLVSGKDKAAVLRRLLTDGASAAELPASHIHAGTGTLRWMLDAGAAEGLITPP